MEKSKDGDSRSDGREQIEDYKFALDQSSIVAITDLRGIITYVNQKFCEISGYSSGELVGKTHRLVNSGFHPSSFFREMWETLTEGQVWRGRIRNRTKNGGIYWVDTTIVPFLGEDSIPYQYLAIRTDITEQIVAEEKLEEERRYVMHMQKLESLGTMAGGIAHDFNNILQGISMATESLRPEFLGNAGILEALDGIRNLTVRGSQLVSQILTFSGKDNQIKTGLCLNEILDEVVSMMRATLDKSVEICRTDHVDKAMIEGNSTQMLQVLINLCTNAAYVLRDSGGQISFDLSELENEEKRWYRIIVADSGPGIPDEIVDQIFEPFFTTKPTGVGTGMGLSIVYGIVNSHGGRINLIREPGVTGCCFHIDLPALAAEAPVETREAPAVTTLPGSGTSRSLNILFVDDDQMILHFGGNLLEDLGHEVVRAASGEEALDLFMDDPDKWDLVISDLSMGGMSGLDLGRRLSARRSLPMLLASGNADAADAAEVGEAGFMRLINKPFAMDDLRRILDALPGPG